MHHNSPSLFQRPDKVKDTLYIIAAVFNPGGWRSRMKHGYNISKHVLDMGASLVLIEATFGDREKVFVQTLSDRHIIIHVQSKDELWLKENLLNLAVQHLTVWQPNWRYMATLDADMAWARPDIVGETLRRLQHHPIVQMYSEIIYLSQNYEQVKSGISFMEGWKGRGIALKTGKTVAQDQTFFRKEAPEQEPTYGRQYGWTGAPGGAWAYTREGFEGIGGLIDFAILGSADHYMALGLFGIVDSILNPGFHPEYKQWILDWQDRAVRNIKKNVGYIQGVMFHYWHGDLKQRHYGDRNQVLVRNQYNPRTDIRKNSFGVLQLDTVKWQLRDDLKSYTFIRNEDSTE